MTICHISDTHGKHKDLKIPECDVLIHSGDISNSADPYKNENEVRKGIRWLGSQKAKHKIYVAGNHDTSIEARLFDRHDIRAFGVTYLEHEAVVIDGVRFFGSPYCSEFNQWAFNRNEDQRRKYWIFATHCDVLITHSPAYKILDDGLGCEAIRRYLDAYDDNPPIHLFGHIHEARGNNGKSYNSVCLNSEYEIDFHGHLIQI